MRKRTPGTPTSSPTKRKNKRPKIRYEWFLGKGKTRKITLHKLWPTFFVLLVVHMTGSFLILFRSTQDDAVDNVIATPAPFLRTTQNSNPTRYLPPTCRRHKVGGIDNLSKLGYANRPRAVVYDTDNVENRSPSSPSLYQIPDDFLVYPSKRTVPLPEGSWERQEKILNSGHYQKKSHAKYKIYDKYPECQPMYDWQTTSFPSCNNVHEVDLTDLSYERNKWHRRVYYKAHGFFRDVFVVRDAKEEKRVLKTLRMKHEFDEKNYDRHRKDAVAMERLTSSPFIMDIYGFCGQTALFDYGVEGNIEAAIWDNEPIPTFVDRLRMATQVAQAVSNLHNFFDKGPAIAHTDIMSNQFIYTNGRYMLNDFNRAIFLYWNTTSDTENCPFVFPDENAWLFRAPEEYAYEFQSEKIDVYSMGNVFFVLLENDYPFHESAKEPGVKSIQQWVKAGRRPEFTNEWIRNTNDPAVTAMKHAMHMCWEQDWSKRATAREVEEYLVDALARIESDPVAVERSNKEFAASLPQKDNSLGPLE